MTASFGGHIYIVQLLLVKRAQVDLKDKVININWREELMHMYYGTTK